MTGRSAVDTPGPPSFSNASRPKSSLLRLCGHPGASSEHSVAHGTMPNTNTIPHSQMVVNHRRAWSRIEPAVCPGRRGIRHLRLSPPSVGQAFSLSHAHIYEPPSPLRDAALSRHLWSSSPSRFRAACGHTPTTHTGITRSPSNPSIASRTAPNSAGSSVGGLACSGCTSPKRPPW
jgi:hypothetical protein